MSPIACYYHLPLKESKSTMSTPVHQEPTTRVDIGTSSITLLGTAHVSHSSAEAVNELLESNHFDAVAVELCPSRYNAIIEPDSLAKMDLMQVVRKGKVAMIMANLAMGAYQQRIADQLGIEPGAEQRMAIDVARKKNLPVLLIDREIGVTLKRTASSLPWWKRWTLVTGLMLSLLSREEVEEEEIEQLKEGDMLETAFAEFAHDRQDLFQPLISERDQYMAARLQQETAGHDHENVLAVIGAGHLQGVTSNLQNGIEDPDREIDRLDQLPPPAKWPKVIPWLIAALVLIGFVVGFMRSPDLGWQLISTWVLINGTLSAIGAALAWAHPLTIATAFIAAPITSLNPTIGAGMVTAAVEIWLHKPTVSDFESLRKDTTSLRGWWKNRVSRTLLVFLFSTLGSAIGTYVAGFKMLDYLRG